MEIEERRRKRSEGWFSRHKTILLLLTVFAIVVGFLVYFGFYRKADNRDLSDSELVPDSPQASALIGGFPAKGSSKSASKDMTKLFLNIGLRQDFLLQECQGTSYKLSFPNIDYALMGYNILRGYPLATGHDPGFTYPIFTADYGVGKQTADCRYSVPQGFVVIPGVSCVTSFSSKVVQTKYEFANALSVSASVSGGGWGASFSASAGYKQSSSNIAFGESVYILSSASCHYYFSKLVSRMPPPFDPVFLNWVKRLENTNSKDTYIDFFNTYGTHFPTEVTFGARFTYEHKMSSKQFETQSEKGVNVAVQASYSGLFSVGGGLGMDSSQRQAASDFSKSVETKTITVGAAPPANGDAMTWASTVKDSPVPSKYKLSSIDKLFTDEFFDQAISPVNHKKISDNIKKYKLDYCNHLKWKGEVESCLPLSPGMLLDHTRLYSHYVYMRSSFQECVDQCLKKTKCTAITYCETCDSTSDDHRTCYQYSTDREISAETSEGWRSVIFVSKITSQLSLKETEVVGTERGFEREEDKNADVSKCNDLCKKDPYCAVYSHCNCTDVQQKCKLFSFVSVLGFRKDEGTKSVVVPKK